MLWHLVSLDATKEIMEEDSTIVAHQQMRALTIINLSIKYEVIPHISHLDNPHEVWTILKYLYESTRIVKWLMFRNKFYKLIMQDETNMLDFVHYKGSFGLDCRNRRCYQGWKCGTYTIECFTKILQDFHTKNVHSRNFSKLWSIDL